MALARTCFFGATTLFLTSAAALAQEACNTYTVAAGDNLRFIARAAYGDADLYRLIFDANVDQIGAKADHIEIGMQLTIPCGPGDATTEVAAASTGDTAVATPASPAETTMKPIGIVTGNGYAPFADEMLQGGGMFTQLVEMAIFRADPSITYNMTFISDWQAHIDALLPSQAYDLSFPWVRPDCETPEILSPSDTTRCQDFVFSAPFYEVVEGFFALTESGLAAEQSYAAYEGKRICRPEAYTTGVLDSHGLSMSKITLVRPAGVNDCFEALRDGEVDLVAIDAEVGDSAAESLGMTKLVTQNPHLTTLTSLHVIAHKSNPRAIEMIVKLDSGIIEMYESGEWYDVVSNALKAKMAEP